MERLNDGVVRTTGEEKVMQHIPVRKIAEKNPKQVVPRRQGGVRFGIVGVLERIEDSSNDKKVSYRKVSFGNSEVVVDLGLEF